MDFDVRFTFCQAKSLLALDRYVDVESSKLCGQKQQNTQLNVEYREKMYK